MSFGWLWYLSVIPALGLLVFVHELGHFLVGLRMGVTIEEFGFGYPPRMLTLFHYRGVPVTLNWLPLGGFVRFAGEESNFDDPHSLAAASPLRRIPIMAAGAIMNILAAILILALLAPFGTPENVGTVSVASVNPGSPADGVLHKGDKVKEVAHQPVHSQRELLAVIKAHQGQKTTFTIIRDNREQEVNLTPRPPSEAAVRDGAVGIGITMAPEDVTGTRNVDQIRNPLSALWFGVTETFRLFGSMLTGLGVLVGSLFGLSAKPQGGLAGPVGIARLTGEVARTGGLRGLLRWTAVLSVNLALINLLPIPALDGSRIVFALIEWIRGKKVPPQREAMVHAAGMMLLLGLMLLITFTDVSNWLRGHDAFGG